MRSPTINSTPMARRASWLLACALSLAGTPGVLTSFGRAAPAKDPSAENSDQEANDQVLRHAVFFKFKDSATEKDVEEVVAAFRALPSKIKEIRELQSGKNIGRKERSDGLTHCFLLTFADEEGRTAYLPHPDHKAFGSVLRPHLDQVFVIDYWGKPQATRLENELKHAVFVKFKDDAPAEEVKAVEQGLADLPGKIQQIQAFEWGKNNSPEKHDAGFTHCFMFTFDSEKGLQEYIDDPVHKAVADKLVPLAEKIRVLDFWSEEPNKPAER